jgi:thiamine pyrophosphate-dependent acetolactate synthase large subunit-like protein
MNGGRIIAQVLKEKGVKFLFTLCGGHISPIYIEAEKAGIKVIDVRNEATAVFAADAVSRLTAVTGVAAVTAGPGITNCITPLKNVQLAQSAVLVIAGATATLLRNRGALQDIDQVSIVKSLVKKIFKISRLKQLGPALQQAISVAGHGVPGPVFMECPADLLYDETIVRDWYSSIQTKKNNSLKMKVIQWYIQSHINKLFNGVKQETFPAQKNKPDPKATKQQLKKLAGMINQSTKPVLVMGSGSMFDPTLAIELAEAINTIGIPTYLSGMSRGLLGINNPVHFHHKRKEALKYADLIILAGLPVDFRLNYGKGFSQEAKKITINLNKSELRKNINPQQTIYCNPAHCIISLQKEKYSWPIWNNWKIELKEREDKRATEINEMAALRVDSINPVSLFQKMEQMLPPNSIFIADGGDFAATCSYILHPRKPLGWLDAGLFGTLGAGGGFALGAALCNPGDYVFIVYGDGSAGYSITEFDTFTKLGLRICAIVGNNGSWAQVAREQVTLLGADTATKIPRSNYHLIAKSFGADGERTDTIRGFEQALKNALQSMDKGIPYLINAIIESTAFREGSISF